MNFLAFLLLVWLLLAGLGYAAWMLRDAWKKRPPTRLLFTPEIAAQVVMAVGVCVVVGFALHSILRDDSFQDARSQVVSWVASWNTDQQPKEELSERIPADLFKRESFRADGPIVWADIGTRSVTQGDIEWMVQEYPDLDTVLLSGQELTAESLVRLSELKNLRVLALSGVPLTNDGLAQLALLTNLRKLELSYCRISDAGLVSLASMTELVRLDLTCTAITNDGLVHLKRLDNLRELHLKGTCVTDVGLRHLEKLPKLQTVYFGEGKLRSTFSSGMMSRQGRSLTMASKASTVRPLRSQYTNGHSTSMEKTECPIESTLHPGGDTP